VDLEAELLDLRQQLAAVGRDGAPAAEPSTPADREQELSRWLAVNPRAGAAGGFRAGWARLSRWTQPRLRDWEHRWWRAVRENDRLRARIGTLLREISRLTDGA
jgi:hypothetical protein